MVEEEGEEGKNKLLRPLEARGQKYARLGSLEYSLGTNKNRTEEE